MAHLRASKVLVLHDPSARPQTGYFLTLVADLGRGSGPRGLEMAAACPGVDSQDLATILDPLLLSSQPGSELLSAG